MRQFLGFVAGIVFLVSPAQAHDWADQTIGRETGMFVGAQLHVPVGRRTIVRPRVSLGVAPTFSRLSTRGLHTNIGERLPLSLAPGSKPNLTLGGVRADAALGLARESRAKTSDKLGVSTGGWVAIGVGTVLVAGLVGYALWVDHMLGEEREDC